MIHQSYMIGFLSFLILEGVQGSQRDDLFWFQHPRVNPLKTWSLVLALTFLSQSEQKEVGNLLELL